MILPNFTNVFWHFKTKHSMLQPAEASLNLYSLSKIEKIHRRKTIKCKADKKKQCTKYTKKHTNKSITVHRK